MKKQHPLPTFMSEGKPITVGYYPEQWTKNEKRVYEEMKSREWMLARTIQLALSDLNINSVNNALRRLYLRGVVDKKEDKVMKRMFWVLKDEV